MTGTVTGGARRHPRRRAHEYQTLLEHGIAAPDPGGRPSAHPPCGRASSHHPPWRRGSRCRCCDHPLFCMKSRGGAVKRIPGKVTWQSLDAPAQSEQAPPAPRDGGHSSTRPLTAGGLLHEWLADALPLQFHIVFRLHKPLCESGARGHVSGCALGPSAASHGDRSDPLSTSDRTHAPPTCKPCHIPMLNTVPGSWPDSRWSLSTMMCRGTGMPLSCMDQRHMLDRASIPIFHRMGDCPRRHVLARPKPAPHPTASVCQGPSEGWSSHPPPYPPPACDRPVGGRAAGPGQTRRSRGRAGAGPHTAGPVECEVRWRGRLPAGRCIPALGRVSSRMPRPSSRHATWPRHNNPTHLLEGEAL